MDAENFDDFKSKQLKLGSPLKNIKVKENGEKAQSASIITGSTEASINESESSPSDANFNSTFDWVQQLKQDKITLNDYTKIVSWNVNGLRAVLRFKSGDHTSVLLHYLDLENPDILFLSETKLNLKVINDFKSIHNSYIIHNECHNKPGYAGVALFLKKTYIDSSPKLSYSPDLSNYIRTFQSEKYAIGHGINDKEMDTESRALTLLLEKFILVGTYSLNAGQGLKRLGTRVEKWDKSVFEYLAGLQTSYKQPVIWCGDLNIALEENDVWNSKACSKLSGHTPQERNSFKSHSNRLDLVDLWRHKYPNERQYTFWSAKSVKSRSENLGWRIDCFISKKDFAEKNYETLIRTKVPGSDHVPIVLAISNSDL